MNVRIVARWEDDPLESAITLDARLDANGRGIAGAGVLFGATGLGTKQMRPFTLDGAGTMDFGAACEAMDRYWKCDIRQRDISVGGLFEVVWSGGERGLYRIEKIATPGSKSSAE